MGKDVSNEIVEFSGLEDTEDSTEEADKVAVRMVRILSEKAFSFTPNEYISIHKKLFAGIYGHAGKLRDIFLRRMHGILEMHLLGPIITIKKMVFMRQLSIWKCF